MDEKKVSDEQKAMYELNAYRNRYYAEPQGTEKAIIANAINDLFNIINSLHETIYKQKAEIGRLKKQVKQSVKDMKLEVSIRDREIERLTEEKKRIAWTKKEYLDWVHGFLATHTEMKDRGEKYEMFDRDWMCNVFWAKIKGSIEYIIDLEKQRNELQTKVDELNEQFLSTCENCHLKKDIELLQYQKEQSVKDTAKEILDELLDIEVKDEYYEMFFLDVCEKLEKFAQKYGVKVE